MNKVLGAVFGFIGAILLLLPVAAFAGPVLPGEPVGTNVFCSGSQSNSRSVTISSALGRVQPLRPHGTCTETISISDTRVNITILGDGGDTLGFGSACADPNNTIVKGEDPSQAQIIQVRGRNITITGIEIFGQNITDPPFRTGGVSPTATDTKFLNNNLGLFGPRPTPPGFQVGDALDFDPSAPSNPCPGTGAANANQGGCNNNRGIRAQRGGIFLVGRHTTTGGFLPVLTINNHQSRQYEEKTGVCIHHVSKNGIEVTQGSLARIINSEIHDVGGDAIAVSETSHATIGFSSGAELNLTSDPFPGQGNGGPNFLHNNSGNGVAVQRNSYARVVGNTISGNATSGINVTRGSGADVTDNLLNANSQFGIAVNDNSQVNMGTTGNNACSLTAKANVNPLGGPSATLPSAAGNQCPGDGGTLQNTGTTGSGVVNVGNLANSVTVNNTSGGISCVRSYIAGRSTKDRANGASNLSANATSVFTSCVSNLN